MTFILSAERSGTPEQVSEGFARYREYLASHADRFPPGAFELATSGWYFDPRDRRCPHDGKLHELRLSERKAGEDTSRRTAGLVIRLVKPHDDVQLEFAYPEVIRYAFHFGGHSWGHSDWRYDQFRLSEDGHVIHEIEWAGPGRWEIVASDVRLRVIPSEGNA